MNTGADGRYMKLAYNIGYNSGEKELYNPKGFRTREGEYWYSLFVRCYSEYYLSKKPRYRGCTVDSRFHDFAEFLPWFKQAKGSENMGWQIDKDVLIKNNKVYSPDSCVLVPRDINIFYVKREKCRGDHPIGVTYHKPTGKYLASGYIRGVNTHLGLFTNPEDAFYVFNEHKKTLAKQLASRYRNLVDDRVIEALLSFELSIDD